MTTQTIEPKSKPTEPKNRCLQLCREPKMPIMCLHVAICPVAIAKKAEGRS
ncbi:MAG: hypothetical protein PHV74_13905 [Dehalococcoidia bacterium]|nr:hypothetical protein [Dehalococcoidia bacterium]